MASYRYERDIAPADLAPRAEKRYTRKERWADWWDYNLKWVLLIGIAATFVAYSFIGQYFFTAKLATDVAGGEELWQALTAGAVSTVEAEG